MDLSAEAVVRADRLICADPRRVGMVNAKRAVDEIRLWFDPDRAKADEEASLAARWVRLRQSRVPATTEVTMLLDTPDALAFDRTVGEVAGVLGDLGDTDVLDVRRAKAVGVLADPQRALDLVTGASTVRPGLATPATLYLHLDAAAVTGLRDQGAPVTDERLGVLSKDLLERWLRDSVVQLRPVLHLESQALCDAHDPPVWMREAVLVRDATCVFPGCRRSSRRCDLDHIEPFVPLAEGGPPGQTRVDNLAPLCRAHHRAKTFGGWSYDRQPGGGYRWRSPSGLVLSWLPPDRRPPTPPGA